jgi:thiamine pyrophosphate-dependent acetolactate synthase large subunit-like protein
MRRVWDASACESNTPDELSATLRRALETPGMVVVDIPTDYSKNAEIGQHVIPEAWD